MYCARSKAETCRKATSPSTLLNALVLTAVATNTVNWHAHISPSISLTNASFGYPRGCPFFFRQPVSRRKNPQGERGSYTQRYLVQG